MKTLIVSLLFGAALASAQTEVRHAIVLPSYKDLKYPPLPPLKIPDPVEVTLSNGMKVLLLEDHELPLVSGAALIRTGNLFDPSNKREILVVRLRQVKMARNRGQQAQEGRDRDNGGPETPGRKTARAMRVRVLLQAVAPDCHCRLCIADGL